MSNTTLWLGLGAALLVVLIGDLVHQARRTADAVENMAAQTAYIEGLLTGLAEDVEALRQLTTQEGELGPYREDDVGGGHEH